MNRKLRKLQYFIQDRLAEASTWQGVGFLLALSGSKIGLGMDWGMAVGIGSILSALIKMFCPDKRK